MKIYQQLLKGAGTFRAAASTMRMFPKAPTLKIHNGASTDLENLRRDAIRCGILRRSDGRQDR